MAFEETWRWFGPKDQITLREIKQTGATGIVTALHQIPVGEVWTVDEILKRKKIVEDEGFTWSVVESVPVHEDIKKQSGKFKVYIENYKETIRNLSRCGINIICYNFMPVLDWSRTDLNVMYKDGAITTKFESDTFAAFDLFILKRENAENDYTSEKISRAKKVFEGMSESQKSELQKTILFGLPGSLEAYSLDEFRSALKQYDGIGHNELRANLSYFLKEVTPIAEESGVYLAIHPDDPPWSLLGLPRVVGSKDDLQFILDSYQSNHNGLTFCSGSLGAGFNNNLTDIAKSFSDRINFVHLRNLTRDADNNFMESYHLEGDVDIYEIMKTLLTEQRRRAAHGQLNARMPMRPDHGHLMLAEQQNKNIYPGYSLGGRMKGLAELRGMQTAILRSFEN
ncbi:MAG: mannonate dehydratase [Ignavibacteriales bacterium]|nr:MAG: mannonate dehydratase [Ignavibacteriales bacterium]